MTASVNNVEYLRAASSSGCFYTAALTETAPTDAATALGGSFVSLGLVSVDGLKMKIGNEEVNLEDWTGDEVLVIESKQNVEFTVKPLCFTDGNVLKERFGASNVTESNGVVTGFAIKATQLPSKRYVFEMVRRAGGKARIVVLNGKVTGDVEYNFDPKNPTAADWTIKAAPDTNGVKVMVYFAEAESGETGVSGA